MKLDHGLLQRGMELCEGKLLLQAKEQYRCSFGKNHAVHPSPIASFLFKSEAQIQRNILDLELQKHQVVVRGETGTELL